MRAAGAALLAGATIGSATAHEAKPVEEAITACLQTSENRPSATPCLQGLLSESEQQLKAAVTAKQKLLAEIEDTLTPKRIGALRRVEAAFNEYRRRLCTAQRMENEPGSGAGQAELACQIRLTQHHAAEVARN